MKIIVWIIANQRTYIFIRSAIAIVFIIASVILGLTSATYTTWIRVTTIVVLKCVCAHTVSKTILLTVVYVILFRLCVCSGVRVFARCFVRIFRWLECDNFLLALCTNISQLRERPTYRSTNINFNTTHNKIATTTTTAEDQSIHSK